MCFKYEVEILSFSPLDSDFLCVSPSIKVPNPMHLLGFKVMLNPCNKLCPKLGDDTLEVIALCNLSETWR